MTRLSGRVVIGRSTTQCGVDQRYRRDADRVGERALQSKKNAHHYVRGAKGGVADVVATKLSHYLEGTGERRPHGGSGHAGEPLFRLNRAAIDRILAAMGRLPTAIRRNGSQTSV
jgi:hypothetical protein